MKKMEEKGPRQKSMGKFHKPLHQGTSGPTRLAEDRDKHRISCEHGGNK